MVKFTDVETRSGALGKKFSSFTIAMRMGKTTWTLQKRYRDFYALNTRLQKTLHVLKELNFPPKKWFGNLAQKTVMARKSQLEQYIRSLLQLQPRPEDISDFLEINAHAISAAQTEQTGSRVSVDDFELLKVIGKGSFGKVFLVKMIHTDKVYAMKVLSKEVVKRRKQVEHTRTERRIMGSIHHPFIVTLRYAFQSKEKLYMVSDYCRGGELFFHLKRRRTFSENLVQFYSAELASALFHLHNLNIVYRDLKPENILLDDQGHIQLTDFGLSKEEVTDSTSAKTFCGTPEYLAPEMILNRHSRAGYGVAVDWWSFGTLIYEMLTGWPPFYDKNIKRMCEKILAAPLVFPVRIPVSQVAQNLIRGLLTRDPVKRLLAEHVRAHMFYKEIDWFQLDRREYKPPFVPNIASPTDIQYFEKEFTREVPELSPENTTGGASNGGAASVGEAQSNDFQDFTFLDSGALHEEENSGEWNGEVGDW